MFDILEADIVIFQETKIQWKDIRDDMVLIPGWDVYFSLPKHKKGYSGVAIYTRTAVCSPIRAEEGITGVLSPHKSSISFRDQPAEVQIGGYPTPSQLSLCSLDPHTIDSEGRCIILEFPAFVLIGTYCPATRDESRDEFRHDFLTVLDIRVRNLIAGGKRVILTGDLNIIRGELDSAYIDEVLVKKEDIDIEEFYSSPARRLFNQLVVDGKVIGERDEGRKKAVMWDICRYFHPSRHGMYTCWDQKINARPGNFGSRIDYILCSIGWNDWFCKSDIQEGLMGSDHCPVYAELKQMVELDGSTTDIRDIMSKGMFKDGIRQREWSTNDLLPMSARVILELNRRRSIKDMFLNLSTAPSKKSNSCLGTEETEESRSIVEVDPVSSSQEVISRKRPLLPQDDRHQDGNSRNERNTVNSTPNILVTTAPASSSTKPLQRAGESSNCSVPSAKRAKYSSQKTAGRKDEGRSQGNLRQYFTSKPLEQQTRNQSQDIQTTSSPIKTLASDTPHSKVSVSGPNLDAMNQGKDLQSSLEGADEKESVDNDLAVESWSKLLTKRSPPLCDHDEPCISLVTKKPGLNCGKSFYICARPLGPSGKKEKNSSWRCGTFIWNSDWTRKM
ncbi:BgTH12-04558 [Blumeria graminis f. sp. triticale]|uniref:DNA-(apurinic or apyrimidinic site) endonuclease 2 n=1 Tax=Blumeria graminis f. sp. triticale TaxID=1689686 RepID=A0A9W4CUX7_BLUGR|nr:BgTH12-04558 [Blumeria graminis f. sp. triticale]